MGTPINTPVAGEIWHLSIDDLFAPLPEKHRLGGAGPFVINLSVSTVPINQNAKSIAGKWHAHVYQIQVNEDGRTRYRLRLGPFASEEEADAVLETARDLYPGALTATAGHADLQAIEGLLSGIDAQRVRAERAGEKAAAARQNKPTAPVAAKVATESPHASPPSIVPVPPAPMLTAAPNIMAPPAAAAPPAKSAPMATEPTIKPALAAEPPILQLVAEPPVLNAIVAPAIVAPVIAAPGSVAPVVVVPVIATPAEPPSVEAQAAAPPVLVSRVGLPSARAVAASPPSASPAAKARVSSAPPVAATVQTPAITPPAKMPATLMSTRAASVKTSKSAPATLLAPQLTPITLEPPRPAPSTAASQMAKPSVAKASVPPEPMPPAALPPGTPWPRVVKPTHKPLTDLESTQTVRALTSVELDNAEAKCFVIQLSLVEHELDPESVPNLDIFSEYRLYSVVGRDQGRIMHALRLGFFADEIAANIVATYLSDYYDKPSVVRVSLAEQERFEHQRVEARKDVGATGRHMVIEITDELVARRRRVTLVEQGDTQRGNSAPR